MAHDLGRGHLGPLAVHRDVELLAEHFELGDGGRTVGVRRDQQRAFAALAQRQGQLGGRRGLAGALQTDQHHDMRRRPRQIELGRLAQRRQQLLVHDLDDLLRRREALHHLGADRALTHARHKLLDDLEVHVRFEQRQADLAQRDIHVLLGQPTARGELIKDGVQFGLQALEHIPPISRAKAGLQAGPKVTCAPDRLILRGIAFLVKLML